MSRSTQTNTQVITVSENYLREKVFEKTELRTRVMMNHAAFKNVPTLKERFTQKL